jgi:hypothetical protein
MKVNGHGLTFKQWYREANDVCAALCGLDLDDLADGPSNDAWADDVTPEEYVHDRLEDEGFPFE